MINLAFALFGVICLFGISSKASKNINLSTILYVLIGIVLTLFCGLREVGADQDSVAYARYYDMDDYGMSLVVEPTFIFISHVSRFISNYNGIRYLFIIYAIIGVSIKFIAITKLTNLRWLSLLTYFSTYFLLHEFTQIRVAVATGLLLLSLKYIYERKMLLFVLLIGMASLFHYSAMPAIFLYFLSKDSLSKFSKLAIAMAVPAGIVFYIIKIDFIYVIPIDLIRSKIQIYMEAESIREIKLNVFNTVYLVKYAILYVLLIFSDKIGQHSRYFPILLKVYAISLFLYLALSFNATFAMRISEMFGIVEIILVPLLYYAIRVRSLAVLAIGTLAMANLALGIYQTELIQTNG